MKKTFEVTQEDIVAAVMQRSDSNQRGLPYGHPGYYEACTCCPVARAMQRAGYPKATVSKVHAYTDNLRLSAPLRISYQVMDFITDFDEGRAVKPFTFELDIP